MEVGKETMVGKVTMMEGEVMTVSEVMKVGMATMMGMVVGKVTTVGKKIVMGMEWTFSETSSSSLTESFFLLFVVFLPSPYPLSTSCPPFPTNSPQTLSSSPLKPLYTLSLSFCAVVMMFTTVFNVLSSFI